MADIILEDVKKELNIHLASNPNLVAGALYSDAIQLDKYAKPLAKIKGQYPSAHTLLTDVVQGFTDEWTEMGVLQITHKILTAYHQKVNFPLKPHQIRNSYFGHLATEGKKITEYPFSKYVMDVELLPKVVDNVNDLSINGEYDATRLNEYGYSMNGIAKIIDNILADTKNPGFKIPLDVPTDDNMVDIVTAYERALPKKAKSKVKVIYMSLNNLERYILDYEERFGQNKFQNDVTKTRLGKRVIVGLEQYEGDLIWSSTENNFKKLYDDIKDKPRITDLQILDYKIKVFMEFTKGYDFLINQQVFISNYSDETLGLGATEMNQNYYGIGGVTVTV